MSIPPTMLARIAQAPLPPPDSDHREPIEPPAVPPRTSLLLRSRRFLVLALCGVSLAALSWLMEPLGASATPQTEAPARPLGELVGRNHRLKIEMGPLGPTYTLTSLTGDILDSDTDLALLSDRHPGLHLDRSLAGEQSGGRVFMLADDGSDY